MISNFEQFNIIPIIGSVFAVLFLSAILITICKNNPDCGSNCCASKKQLTFQVRALGWEIRAENNYKLTRKNRSPKPTGGQPLHLDEWTNRDYSLRGRFLQILVCTCQRLKYSKSATLKKHSLSPVLQLQQVDHKNVHMFEICNFNFWTFILQPWFSFSKVKNWH